MKNIYDNGSILLGELGKIKDYIKGINDNDFIDEFEDLKKDLDNLSLNNLDKDVNEHTIVAIYYDSGNGYSIDWWNDSHILKEEE